jgi:hypothetical protein
MSLITVLHTFAGWAEKEFKVIESKEPAVERIAYTSLTYAKIILPTILVAEGDAPAAAAAVAVINTAQNDLTAVQGVINDAGATAGVAAKLQSVAGNLGTLLTVGQVKDAKSVANVTNVVNSLSAVAKAILPAA